MQQTMSWEFLWGIGIILLFLGIIYGFLRNRRRSPKEKAVTEAATRELYEDPARYERRTREELKDVAAEAKAEEKARRDRS